MQIVYDSVLTCPYCRHQSIEHMPASACVRFHECPECHMLLRPKPGDCCVFCSYASVRCSPKQRAAQSS